MLRSVRQIHDSRINASDDQIGHVKEAYFDDATWTIRYLVVDTGNWLTGRKVLISPYSIKTPLTESGLIDVTLTRDQVKNSPDIDTHKPLSRRHERDYLTYYGYPSYWEMGGVWGAMDYPLFPYVEDLKDDVRQAEHHRDSPTSPASVEDDEDSHLRSTADVSGYDIQASDGSIGHVHDFVFDDANWAIRYLVVDTVNWWPGGKRVLVATRWIDGIDWTQRKVSTSLSRDNVKNSPDYDQSSLLDRQYEERLHEAHQRAGYWE
jgi:PRC-barrel domain